MNMKKKVYIIVMIALILIIIAEGFVIYSQHTIIKKDKEEKEAYVSHERKYIRRLSEQLKLERKGLRHDTRGGDFCPACDGTNIVRIAYGYSPQMSKEEIEEKRVVHGGCVVTEDSKQFVCKDCKYKWGSLDIFRKNDTTNTNYRKPCEDL